MARARSLRVVKSEASLELDMNPVPPVLSQTEQAVSVIRDRIIDLTLEPGSKLDERLLKERFKLGRTPAREADEAGLQNSDSALSHEFLWGHPG